ncbi:hypothetical protein LguiA_020904 [Lonicera macranthoides]
MKKKKKKLPISFLKLQPNKHLMDWNKDARNKNFLVSRRPISFQKFEPNEPLGSK